MINGHGIGKYLSRIYRLELKYLKPVLEAENIPPSCFSFIINLHHHPGISQKQLCEITQHDQAIATRLIKHLEKEGLVNKIQNPKDHRAFQLYLTDKGNELYPKIEAALGQWWDVLLKDIPVEDLRHHLMTMTDRAIELSQDKGEMNHE